MKVEQILLVLLTQSKVVEYIVLAILALIVLWFLSRLLKDAIAFNKENKAFLEMTKRVK